MAQFRPSQTSPTPPHIRRSVRLFRLLFYISPSVDASKLHWVPRTLHLPWRVQRPYSDCWAPTVPLPSRLVRSAFWSIKESNLRPRCFNCKIWDRALPVQWLYHGTCACARWPNHRYPLRWSCSRNSTRSGAQTHRSSSWRARWCRGRARRCWPWWVEILCRAPEWYCWWSRAHDWPTLACRASKGCWRGPQIDPAVGADGWDLHQ